MKRNWDTIREILLRLEEKGLGEHPLQLSSWPKDILPEISCHVELLKEAGLIHGRMSKEIGPSPHDFVAIRLTWEGHELLDAIRNDTIWNKTKESFISRGISMTFDLVKSVAVNFATEFLKNKMSGG
jgi:hypothetical protein